MAEPLAAAGDGIFPPTLEEVPAGERATEQFGWMPVVCGVVLVGFAFGLASERRSNLTAAAPLGLVGVLLAFYEVWRRRAPTSVARRGNQVAVYRGGRLAESVAVGQITRYYLNLLNTLKVLLIPAVLVMVGVILFIRPGPLKDGETMLALGSLALGFVTGSSLVRTRFLLHHYYVPKGRRREEVLLGRADSARLFGPQK